MSDSYYQDHWGRHLDISFDALLTPLLNKGMNWMPWIGRDFSRSDGKLLIVGESNYIIEPDSSKVAEMKAERQANGMYQREVIAEYPLVGYEAGWNNNGRRNNPTFDYLHRALLKTDLLNTSDLDKRGRLWDQLAYYNFVQNVMDFGGEGRQRERPSYTDFSNGWRLFVQVVGILRPKACVFLGVQASDSFNGAMHEMGIQHTLIQKDKLFNGVKMRIGGSVTLEGETTTLVFMRHTSQYFSWKLWNGYLETTMPDIMTNVRNHVFIQPTSIQS